MVAECEFVIKPNKHFDFGILQRARCPLVAEGKAGATSLASSEIGLV